MMTEKRTCVVQTEVALLKPYVGNARTHPRRQIEQIKRSIQEFGFTNPILVGPDRSVIAGHGRLIAAKELGLLEVPVIVLDYLSESQIAALRLADNKIALNSGWDPALLRIELANLSALEIDINVTGFAVGEVNVILNAGADPAEEVVPSLRSAARTRLGDIWELGDHRVGCGDSRDLIFLREVVGDTPIDCAFLDPPYNVKIKGHANVKTQHREFAMASGEMSENAFREFLSQALGCCVQLSRAGAVHFICMDWRHTESVTATCSTLYDEQLNLCVWNKSNAGMGSLYRSKHELVFVYRVAGASHRNTVELGRNGRNRTNVWDYPSVNTFRARQDDLELHPTVKPVAMVADAIQDVTARGDTVLDVFLGAGTTLIACERGHRRFRGLDIDPLYVDLTVDRWAALTNRSPKLHRRAA